MKTGPGLSLHLVEVEGIHLWGDSLLFTVIVFFPMVTVETMFEWYTVFLCGVVDKPGVKGIDMLLSGCVIREEIPICISSTDPIVH